MKPGRIYSAAFTHKRRAEFHANYRGNRRRKFALEETR